MASQEIGSLFVALGLDSAVFTAGVKKVQGVTGKLQKGFEGIATRAEAMGKKLSLISGAMAAFGLAAGSLVNHTAAMAAEIDRQSQVANAGTDEFQRWAAGSKKVGIEQDKLADILKDVNDRVGDFLQTGGGPMADFFENIAPKVGVTAEQFKNLSGPQALQLYVSSLEKAGLSQQEMTFYLEAMASDATALIPLLRNGGAEMTRLGDAASASGAVMSSGLIASSQEFTDKMRELHEALGGVRNRLAEALLPLINKLMDTLMTVGIPAMDAMVTKIENLITWFENLSDPVQQAALAIAAALGTGGPILLAVSVLATALAALMTPTGAIGLLIAGAALIIMYWEPISQFFGDLWEGVKTAAANAWAAIDRTVMASVAWIGQKQAEIEQFFIEGWNSILEYLRGLPAKFIEIGGQIVDGLKEGIKAKWDEMVAWFNGLADGLVADFKSWFDIQSPSRVFRAIGQFITEGLGLGLQDGVPQVEAAMGGVADAVAANGDLTSGLKKFGDTAKTIFSRVAFEGQKLGDVLRDIASSWLGGMANRLMGSAFDQLFGLGANANGTNSWRGGLTKVNERGGEIMNLPRGTQIIPNDISKRMADRSGGSDGVMSINVNVSGARGNAEIQQMVAQGVQQGISAYDRQALPRRVRQVSADKRRIG